MVEEEEEEEERDPGRGLMSGRQQAASGYKYGHSWFLCLGER